VPSTAVASPSAPAVTEREFRRYLECGILAHGFARARCADCGQGWEVAALAAAGLELTGLDFAHNVLALCREVLDRANSHATLVDADVLHWQPAAPVDAVFEQTCLCGPAA
jgi:hypothetical protein